MSNSTIDEFYQYARYINIKEIGGWAPSYYGVFSKVLRENNYKNVAEIGVGYGTHARYILVNNSDIQKLTLIDPMKSYDVNDAFNNDIQSKIPVDGKNNFDRLYELINQDLSQWSDKYTWIRKPSIHVTDEEVPDGSLDAIFVDGDHTYGAVYLDLNKYWPKVRSGGQILGDDYSMSDVERAVRDFSSKVGVGFDLLYKEGSSRPIYRFHKP